MVFELCTCTSDSSQIERHGFSQVLFLIFLQMGNTGCKWKHQPGGTKVVYLKKCQKLFKQVPHLHVARLHGVHSLIAVSQCRHEWFNGDDHGGDDDDDVVDDDDGVHHSTHASWHLHESICTSEGTSFKQFWLVCTGHSDSHRATENNRKLTRSTNRLSHKWHLKLTSIILFI